MLYKPLGQTVQWYWLLLDGTYPSSSVFSLLPRSHVKNTLLHTSLYVFSLPTRFSSMNSGLLWFLVLSHSWLNGNVREEDLSPSYIHVLTIGGFPLWEDQSYIIGVSTPEDFLIPDIVLIWYCCVSDFSHCLRMKLRYLKTWILVKLLVDKADLTAMLLTKPWIFALIVTWLLLQFSKVNCVVYGKQNLPCYSLSQLLLHCKRSNFKGKWSDLFVRVVPGLSQSFRGRHAVWRSSSQTGLPP